MANTTADKLALLEATKADLKAALAEKGQTVGDVFSTYPAAVRAIETTSLPQTVTVSFSLPRNTTVKGTIVYYYTVSGNSVVPQAQQYERNNISEQELEILEGSFLVFNKPGNYISNLNGIDLVESWGYGADGGSLFANITPN